jgi:hypothetical protein
MPPLGKTYIYNPIITIQPDNCDIEIHEQHMDGGIDTILMIADEPQRLIFGQVPPEHQTAQAKEKGVANCNIEGLLKRMRGIFEGKHGRSLSEMIISKRD